jgi:UDP-N-acetylmuramoyl-tripeptide--D-alanyl-D-alanine ligase
MIELSLAEVASAIGGELLNGYSDLKITSSVETDSRLVNEGALFFAKPGEFNDGHNFVSEVAAKGAVAAVVERKLEIDFPQILVPDSVLALGKLAEFVVATVKAQGNLRVIGVTGSNGKTTTKNMLHAILSKFGPTVAPIESYNNEVGAPISMLKIDFDTRFLVVEMGAGWVGSIAYLANMAKPDIAIELKVGLAHVGEFGDVSVTQKIKAELVQALGKNNVAILNQDDGAVAEMAELTEATKIWFGSSPRAHYQISNVDLSIHGTTFFLRFPDGDSRTVGLQILGEHHTFNATAALAAADCLGLDRSLAIAAIEEMQLAERWRMQLLRRNDGVMVINDAYNASPDSMKAALQTLAHLGRGKHRTIAVLGEMAELGAYSVEQHDAIGRLAVRYNIDYVVAVGKVARLIHLGAMQEGSWAGESKHFEEIDEALAYLRAMLEPGDLVLVKSSKSANLRFLGDQLAEVQQ